VFQYYHQYRVEFNYQSDSGSSPPIIAYFELGVEQSTTPGIPVWADAGSTYNYQNPLQASTLNERWYSQKCFRNNTITSTNNGFVLPSVLSEF